MTIEGNLKKLLGLRIAKLRKAKKLTQEQLAEKINTSPRALSCIENGVNYPTPNTLEKLANALGLKPKDLYDFDDEVNEKELYQSIIGRIKLIKKNISKGPFWSSLSFILMCYCVIIFGPNVSLHIENERILSQEIQKSELNDSLKRSRSNIVQDLSFRGIGLGISIDTAKGFISNIKDTVNTEYYIETIAPDSDEREITYHYYTYFRDPEKKYQTLTQAYTGEPSSDTWDLKGELIEKDINIDNQQVRLKLFEQEGLVYAIVLLPKYGDYHFSDFQSLKTLYTKKYGNPEIEGDIFRWSYKNGFIAISEKFHNICT